VDAIGTRNIGARGITNWLSTNWEISTGKQYSMEIEKYRVAPPHHRPGGGGYVNRVGPEHREELRLSARWPVHQSKVIDSDEINAMACRAGFFYVNSGLILAADEEAPELAGVWRTRPPTSAPHHARAADTRATTAEIASIPIMIPWPGKLRRPRCLTRPRSSLSPLGLLEFSRE